MAKDFPTLLRELQNTASFLRHEPVPSLQSAADILQSVTEGALALAQRSIEAEKATALAFLDAIRDDARWADEAEKVTQAERDKKHYRLSRACHGDKNEYVHATIVVEEALP